MTTTADNNKLQKILDIGIALTAEKDPNKLLHLIIKAAMDLTNSDGGTLYTVMDDTLVFRIMRTISKGIDRGADGETINIPPVPFRKENICSYAAITKKALNIPDVYKSDLFDFSGPKRYDEFNSYLTKSMVAIPMIGSDGNAMGVMQLINAMDENGEIRPFTDEETRILMSLASQTAISLSNMAHLKEITHQMWSFTEAMTEAIDARTPYNASHTRNVAKYAGLMVDYINSLHEKGETELFFTSEHKDQLMLAAYLHDIGKMIVPLEVMNKETRLEHRLGDIEKRLEIIGLKCKIDILRGDMSTEAYEEMKRKIDETDELVHSVNNAGFLPDETVERLNGIFGYEYHSPDGAEVIKFLTDEEKNCLMIRKGTLTAEERKIMEGHVEMTERILSKVHFNSSFAMAPKWAAEHHECLNGKGYPRGMSGDDICLESRILAVADICDALLATDRPYKKPMPKEKAFAILEDMAKYGQIDATLVGYIKECI
ncbi:MAG: HD domain-containing phosphohydrolase [Eubacteriales bacterium]|nr:HD domain-containing phosphohydrolase [Eubacteriales bacterium]